jgi:hypothetical protein
MIDWLDAPSNHDFVHISRAWDTYTYEYSGTKNWDLEMGDSVLVWLPGSVKFIVIDPYDTTSVDSIYVRTSFSFDFLATAIVDSILYLGGGHT